MSLRWADWLEPDLFISEWRMALWCVSMDEDVVQLVQAESVNRGSLSWGGLGIV